LDQISGTQYTELRTNTSSLEAPIRDEKVSQLSKYIQISELKFVKALGSGVTVPHEVRLMCMQAFGAVWKGLWREMDVAGESVIQCFHLVKFIAVKELKNINVTESEVKAFLDEASLMMQMKAHKVSH
jgi:hypothetical protein